MKIYSTIVSNGMEGLSKMEDFEKLLESQKEMKDFLNQHPKNEINENLESLKENIEVIRKNLETKKRRVTISMVDKRITDLESKLDQIINMLYSNGFV